MRLQYIKMHKRYDAGLRYLRVCRTIIRQCHVTLKWRSRSPELHIRRYPSSHNFSRYLCIRLSTEALHCGLACRWRGMKSFQISDSLTEAIYHQAMTEMNAWLRVIKVPIKLGMSYQRSLPLVHRGLKLPCSYSNGRMRILELNIYCWRCHHPATVDRFALCTCHLKNQFLFCHVPAMFGWKLPQVIEAGGQS